MLASDRYLVTGGFVDAVWGSFRETYVIELKTRSSPRMLDLAIVQAQEAARAFQVRPMIFMTYLSEDALRLLESRMELGPLTGTLE